MFIPADIAYETSMIAAMQAWRKLPCWPGLKAALALWRAAAVLRNA